MSSQVLWVCPGCEVMWLCTNEEEASKEAGRRDINCSSLMLDVLSFSFPESQGAWGEKESLEVIWCSHMLKQDDLELFAQDHVQMAFVYLRGVRLHSISGWPVPVPSQGHSGRAVFPDVQREPLVCRFVPIALTRWALQRLPINA